MSNALVAVKNSDTGGDLVQLVSFNLDQDEIKQRKIFKCLKPS